MVISKVVKANGERYYPNRSCYNCEPGDDKQPQPMPSFGLIVPKGRFSVLNNQGSHCITQNRVLVAAMSKHIRETCGAAPGLLEEPIYTMDGPFGVRLNEMIRNTAHLYGPLPEVRLARNKR